jgi:hypothetical protein
MKMPQILCTMLLCTALADATHAREVVDGRTLTGNVGSMKAQRGQDRQPPPGASDKDVDSTGRNTGAAAVPHRDSAESQHGSSRLTSPNADRLRSLLNARARGRTARLPSRGSVGPVRTATGKGTGIRGSGGADRESRSTPVASRPAAVSSGPASVVSGMTARGVASPGALSRAVRGVPTIGGPPATSHGFVGGPTIGRTARNATIDGTQLHRPR